jgi:hypothetical protein
MSSRSADRRIRFLRTPIQEYRVGQRRIFVKRDDLCCGPPAPPLGKLRGMEPFVRRLVADGITTLGCWDTRVSKLGHGLAAVARGFPGVTTVVCYPHLKGGAIPQSMKEAKQLGAEVVPMRGNHVSICFAQARRIVERQGGVIIPFGMDCPEAVAAIAGEARTVPPEFIAGGTLVVTCGSGVTLSGLLRGLSPSPRLAIGVSSGRSLKRIRHCVGKYLADMPCEVHLVPASLPYDSAPSRDCPFPTHPNYDLKAWAYMTEHLEHLRSPVLFWNIGA